jgi:hypothetical protein
MGRYIEEILELRKQGSTYKEISQKLNCAISTVSYHCKLHKMGGNTDRLSNSEKIELQKLYDEIGNLKKVAKITGRAFETVQKYVVKKTKKEKISGSQAVIEWRKRVKLRLVEYKGGECQVCGYRKSLNTLQFHHLNPEEKDFSISGKSLSFEKLKNEVDKCLLVCANCHGEIHEGLVKL